MQTHFIGYLNKTNLKLIKKDIKMDFKVTSIPLFNLATMDVFEVKTSNMMWGNRMQLEAMTHIKLNSWLTYGLYGR